MKKNFQDEVNELSREFKNRESIREFNPADSISTDNTVLKERSSLLSSIIEKERQQNSLIQRQIDLDRQKGKQLDYNINQEARKFRQEEKHESERSVRKKEDLKREEKRLSIDKEEQRVSKERDFDDEDFDDDGEVYERRKRTPAEIAQNVSDRAGGYISATNAGGLETASELASGIPIAGNLIASIISSAGALLQRTEQASYGAEGYRKKRYLYGDISKEGQRRGDGYESRYETQNTLAREDPYGLAGTSRSDIGSGILSDTAKITGNRRSQVLDKLLGGDKDTFATLGKATGGFGGQHPSALHAQFGALNSLGPGFEHLQSQLSEVFLKRAGVGEEALEKYKKDNAGIGINKAPSVQEAAERNRALRDDANLSVRGATELITKMGNLERKVDRITETVGRASGEVVELLDSSSETLIDLSKNLSKFSFDSIVKDITKAIKEAIF